MAMKRFAFIFFMVVFTLTNVSLSYAAPCIKMNSNASVEMPNCHDMMQDDQSQDNSKSTHCEGVCFCKHMALSSPFLPLDYAQNNLIIIRDGNSFESDRSFIVVRKKVLFRPPIELS